MKLKQHLLIVLMIILSSLGTYAQVAVPFTQRLAGGSIRIKGDIVFVGNNITNRAPANSPSDANNPYNGTANNNGLNFEYIDVDGDPSTFSSSTADLNISTSCKRIVYAGLYWTATYPFERSGPNGDGTSSNYTGSPRNNSWNQVKFKVPGGTYVDLVADNAADPPGDEDSIIFDGFNAANPSASFYAAPYVCYKNVTSLVQALANANGTYAVANQRAARGIRPDGISSGWSLVIIYESPTLPSKYISTFDGYANIYDGINAANAVDFNVNGFQTLPAPLPVRARIGVSSLEGDVSLTNDRFRIRANSVGGFTTLSNAVNPADNFFNGSISNNGAILTNRNPNSSNTLGYDLDIVNVNNPGNAVIPNGETGATLRVTTNGDAYGTYLTTFDVEIIEPVISLTKVVQDIAGNDIGNAEVQLCQDLVYVIGFQNIGNDDAQNFTIRDVLPVNVTFDQLTTAGALPAGVTIQSYNAATREVVFAINNSLVNQNDPRVEIRLRVKVVCSCLEMDDACSNLIQNQAYATYQGVLNTAQITDDPSLSAFLACNLGDPSPSNFLVNLDNCNFTRTEVLCGPSIVLTAANGYESYVWSGPGTITPVPGTNNQSVTVTQPGTYTVNNNINTSPCKSIVETINVITYGAGVTNPVIPYADQVVICPNNGNQLPLIFLCGAGDSQLIQTNITGATAIEWYQLSGTCTPLPAVNCPNENTSCVWNLLNTGPNFTVTVAGEYRVIVRFPGGCDRTFYFNAYENVLNPTYVSRDVICTTLGQIIVNNVPAGYEYSLSPSGPWQSSNIFNGLSAGTYTVYIRQVGVTGGCVFTIPNIGIRARNFTVTSVVTQPLCTGDKGSINLAANDGEPQYTFTILQGATVVTSVGPIVASNYVFNNLNPGNYTYQVTTQDGCNVTGSFTINTPPVLTVTAALTKPLTCTDGEITVYPVGGTAPYNYVITGAVTVTQSSPVIVAPVAGTYNIQVVDFNNCSATTSIVVNQVQPPVFTIADTDILCASSGNSGTITINVTNANGNTLMYSINNGTSFSSSNVFTNLAPGTYNVVVQYTYGGQACTTAPQAVVITAPPALTGTATLTTTYTCSHPGVITVTASGGTPGYTYSIDGVNFQVGNTFTINAAGTYTITIKDTNGCTITRTVVVPALNGPTDLEIKTQIRVTCPTLTGALNIGIVSPATGGCAARRYRIVSPIVTPYNSSGNFLNLPPGAYTFEIIDCNDCTYQETFVLDPIVPTVITPQVVSNVRCFGTATGSGQFIISNIPNGTDYNYTVTNSGGTTITSASGTTPASGSTNITVNLPNLPASTYTISVYNNYNKCTDTASFTITQPASALTASLTSTPITCTTNGTVTVNASGGWGGYVYTIAPNAGITQSGNTFSNITAGTYTLTTTDSGGCQVTNSITFTNAPALSATISATSDFCYDTTNAATIVVTPSGGTPPFTYTINGTPNSPNTSNTFGPLTPGTYNIVVTDSFGCTFALPSQTINPQLTLSTNLTKDLDCTASPNAVITGTVSGGYPGYTYTVNGGPVTPIAGTTFTYSTATAGTYNFVVTDSRGCVTATSSVTIAPLSLPQITSVTQTQQILCNGDSTAAINVVINTSVGTAPYVINVFNNTTGTDYGTQTSGLPAGNYTITLTDAKSCTDTETIVITQPAPINFTAVVNPMTCTAGGTALGSICVNGLTGGTAPYVYTLTDLTGGTGTQTFSTPLPVNHCFINIDFGIYNLSVTDANGCTLVRTNLVMSSPPSDLDIQISSSIASCAAGGTAVVTVVPIVAGGPYVFGILTQNTPPYAIPLLPADPGFPLQHTFNGLTPGALYTFVVYDTTTGCYYFEQATATVPTNSTMTINPLSPNNVTCIGAADGSVTFSVTGIGAGATSVSYIIYNASTNVATGISGVIPAPFVFPVTAGPLAPGSYYIQLVENGGVNSGCGITSTPFTISQSSTPLAVTATATNDNCNTNAGLITAVGTGGTAPYTYQYLPSGSPAPTAASPGWLASSTANVESGNYDVWIKDAYGCIRSTTVTVNLDPTPVIAATLANACVAQGTYSINVTLTSPGVGPYTLSLDGGAFVTHTFPYTFTGLSSGTHTVQVRDFNGCGNTVSVTILEPLVASAVFTTQPTCNNPNGQITVTATGGSGNYSYSILPNAGITLAGNVFSNVPPGSYTVTVTDTTTGCTTTAPVNLVAPDPVTFTTASTPVVCNGDSNGTITVTLSAGNNNPAYTYQITAGPSTTGPQTSNVFTGLATGTYTILVTSGRGCTATQNVNVGTPFPVVASGSATAFTCAADNSVNTSTVTINGAGGTPTYTYSIDGTNYFTTNTFAIVDNGAVQNITIYVRDANGCIDSDVIVINPLPTLVSATITQNTAITCTNPEQITVTVVGGSGNFNYELIPASGTATPQPQASNVFIITSTGTYSIKVRDLTTGCYIMTIPYEIKPFDTIQVGATATNAVTCFGGTDGSIAINVTDYTGAYTYNVLDSTNTVVLAGAGNTSTNPMTINGLGAGNYTVQITETNSPFCTEVSGIVSVQGPNAALALSAVISAPLTCDPNTAQITATATDGWGTYEYELVGPVNAAFSSNNVFSSLPAGNYTINVRDLEGCLASTSVTITAPLPINTTVTPSTTLLACFGDTNASITIAYPTGGQGSNYSYYFNTLGSDPSSSGPIEMPLGGATITDLGAGTYNVTITDGFNCTFTSANIVINQPTEVNASLVLTNSPSCDNPTVLTLSANGGTPPYTYSADGITYSAATFNPSVAISIPAGTTGVFNYFVRDANGCVSVVSNDIKIDPIPTLTLSTLTHNDIYCGGSATGSITAIAQGGLGNYTYSLVDAGGNPITILGVTQSSPGVFNNLPAGTYYIHVVSTNAFGTCLFTSGPVTITEPLVFNVTPSQNNPTCDSLNNGTIMFSVTGGTGMISYTIDPPFPDQTIQVGTTPVNFTIDNLAAGNYTVLVQDANGCFNTYPFTLIAPPALNAGITGVTPETCAEANEGSFTVSNITGGTTPYSSITTQVIYPGSTTAVPGPSYTLLAGENSHVFDNLDGGHYFITVTDANGCTWTDEAIIDPGVQFTPYADPTFPCDNNGASPSVVVEMVNTDNSPSNAFVPLSDYMFSLDIDDINNAQASNIFTSATYPSLSNPLGSTHTVFVYNVNGCKKDFTFTITPDQIDPLMWQLPGLVQGGLNEIVANVQGGTPPYTYDFNGHNNGNDNSYIYNATGPYTVTVTDAAGCFITMTQPFIFYPIEIPDVFTPDGDGVNDEWSPQYVDESNYPNLITKIYDRYGRVVAELKVNQTWNGKYHGNELPTGDYWYVLKVDGNDGQEFVGHFTLYR
ncbi:T9SS type B sorting domain-containing protein [Flavobacterium terrae]|uniref:Gliding motility-associated C-terminal domain-containing protein n=1 Tax=Flavobacterium terrae TaxID=415425 RepID=A0A1M6AVX2_9FLAO|nr:T9SS type B sorting domain-containing protein [Flavobacterium terrae]SHI40602.1 gliding motility-associated C-terminal domain-containing protein [Flavobacterium terrae]